jgi:hypothetical protein
VDAQEPSTELVHVEPQAVGPLLPALIAEAGDGAARRFFEFFAANIENENTRAAYAQAVGQFLLWAESRRLTLRTIDIVDPSFETTR